MQDTCPLPLLDHWRETVLELLQSHEMLTRLPDDQAVPVLLNREGRTYFVALRVGNGD